MIKFSTILFLLFTVTISHNAYAQCSASHPTKINIIPDSKEVIYDTYKTQEQISNVSMDTINPYGFDTKSHTQGFSSGGINLKHAAKLDYEYLPGNQYVCIWYESVDVKIVIEPHITIASELLDDKCRFNAVKEHELKHVNVDRIVVNNAANSIGENIHKALKSRGFVAGPIRVEQAQDVADRMHDTVSQIVAFELKKLEVERTLKQQAVDTLEEYQRVSNLCIDTSNALMHKH